MDIDTIQAEKSRSGADMDDPSINYEVRFGTLKRQLLIFLGPVVIVVGLALEAIRLFLGEYGAILGLVGFFAVIFGFWMPFHGVLGYAEAWRFEDRAIVRVRRNWVLKSEKRWAYDAVKNVRFKPRDNRILPEMLIQGKGWQALPEQADQLTADRLKALIADSKRANMAKPQDQAGVAALKAHT